MASLSSKSPSPPEQVSATMAQQARPHDTSSQDGDSDLTQSLKRLTITTSPPTRRPALSPLKAADKSPNSPARPSSAMRTPLRSASAMANPPSRSATPTLLRKASMNSLHSINGVAPPRRSSSANIPSSSVPRSGRSPLRSMSPELPERSVPTASSVASDHFKTELEVHHGPEATRRAETVVILQDACYGHRFSRPRTSRANLSTIVERPERIKACALGVSAAYVRLGERHQDGAFPICPEVDPASLPTIPFRIQKSSRRLSLGSQTVTNVHGTKWMEELKIMCDTAEAKLASGGRELQRPDMDRGAHGEAPRKFHEGDLYLCAESLEALEGALGGVCDAVDAVFRPQGPQRAFVAIRPPGHHCSASHPSGFCWINNVHVGIMHAILSHGLTHAAILDFDLHHGDGSQSIAWQHNARSVGLSKNAAWWKKTSIGYFSLHDINSYPCEMGDEDKVRNASICIDNAHGQTIWNVHLEPWKTEADFWALYETKYSVLLEKTRAYLKSHTERLRASGLNSRAAIFLSAGFDASEWEDAGMQRHNVNVPTEFYARLTRDVVRIAAEEGTSVEGRIISVLEGGYSDRALCSGVFSHLCGLAGDGPSNREQELNGIGNDSRGTVPLRARKDSTASERGARRYEPAWWSAGELGQLEAALTGPPVVPTRPRNSTPPTYSSPTQASQARAVNLKSRRSMSGLSPATRNELVSYFSPPPPDVPWTVAAIELSKLLIPGGRQTNSCSHEDLNAESTRARRDRQSALAQSLPPGTAAGSGDRPPTRMGLRERKAKPASLAEDDEDRRSRRKTVAGSSVLPTESASRGPTAAPGKQPRQSGRRLSAASSIMSTAGVDAALPVPQTASIQNNPGTDATTRPESSMSVRTANTSTVNSKKTRAPKKEPAPRTSRAPKKPLSATSAAPQASAAAASSAEKTGDDVDKLTGEMKKIKITVITKAQREARERERLAKEKLTNDETISVRSPAVSEPAPAVEQLPFPSLSPSPEQYHTPPPPQAQSPPHINENPSTPLVGASDLASPAPPTDPRSIPLPASSPPPPGSSSSPTGDSAGQIDVFIPYQPDGPIPEAVALPKQQPLQWMPPNIAGTPVVSPVKKGDLPVFTSTGVIPFAAAAAATITPVVKGDKEAEESDHY
ncbi:histone deacetylase [Madurella fahalii]|uniref:Histone deacetylase n=1 Tax=Madurella fahalii TaxID=1157608 RepID=A0ABQ0GFQ9_9PEZI